MEVQYILIRKNKSEAKKPTIQSEVKAVLQEASFDVGNHLIYFSKDNEDEYLEYRMSYKDNNILYLYIETELNGKTAAKLLDKFNDKLTKGKHRKKFYIINSYSDSSYWFCSKLMPKLGTFERLIREFLYITLTKTYGSEWIKNIDSEIIDNLIETSHGKLKSNNSLIEEALEWLSFYEIENFLFTPRIFNDIDQEAIVDNIINNDSLSKEEIISQIKLIEKKSLWDRVFRNFSKIEDFQEKFVEIRNIRNTVMHNKSVNLRYFEDSISKIEKINKQLIQSIEEIQNHIYNKPRETITIAIDSTVIADAILQCLYSDEDFKRKVNLGKKLTQKYNKIYGPIKVSDLINAHLNEPNNIAKEIDKG